MKKLLLTAAFSALALSVNAEQSAPQATQPAQAPAQAEQSQPAQAPTQAEQPQTAQQNQPEQQVAQAKQPALVMSVYDFSNPNAVPVDTKSLEISRSNKNLRLCWTAFDLPLGKTADVIETFTSPKKAVLKSDEPNLQIQSTNNNTKHVVTRIQEPTVEGRFITKCWPFNKSSYRGNYSLQVRVDNIVYPALSFKVKK